MLELEFKIADPKEQTIPLIHKAEAVDEQGKKIANFKFSPDVKVVISKEVEAPPTPALGCFFFTH